MPSQALDQLGVENIIRRMMVKHMALMMTMSQKCTAMAVEEADLCPVCPLRCHFYNNAEVLMCPRTEARKVLVQRSMQELMQAKGRLQREC